MEDLPHLLGPIRPSSSSCHSPEPGNLPCMLIQKPDRSWSPSQSISVFLISRRLGGEVLTSQVLVSLFPYVLLLQYFFIDAFFCTTGEDRGCTRWSLDDASRRSRHFVWAAYSAHLPSSLIIFCICIFGRPWLVCPFQYEVVRHCLPV
jgi:hypothetical protein